MFDLPSLQQLLADIRSRAVRVVTVDMRVPSPFAAALMFNYVTNFMYEGDAPLAERRAQALTVDPSQLRDLLGGAELRDLLDPAAIDEVERYLQHLAAERAATQVDAVHDLLLRVGDLSDDEVGTRVEERADARAWLEQLERERRIARLHVASEPRWIAVEDAGRYRDALVAVLPEGLPSVFLEPVSDPVGDLVARYARTHGPFRANDAASRLGSGAAVVREALERLARAGRVVEGEFRPGGSGTEWCDANVLRRLRRKSLASLRREAEPGEREHEHEHHSCQPHDHTLADKSARQVSWIGAGLGLVLHTIINGVALGSSVEAESHSGVTRSLAGLGTFLVIFFHKPFDMPWS